MEGNAVVILSKRLSLISLSPDFLQVSLDKNHSAAENLLGLSIPPDWFQEQALIELRLEQLQNEPAFQPWCLRAIGLRQQRIMVGHIGFHTQPGAEYLHDIASKWVEYGYTIYAPFRRQGHAREACEALMKWAYEEQEVTEFVVTVSPENIASIRLAEEFGFERVGSHIDEQDGLEDIYRLDYRERFGLSE